MTDMPLQATYDVIAIVLVLLAIILATWVALYMQYSILKRIERKLSLLEQTEKEIRDSDNADNQ